MIKRYVFLLLCYFQRSHLLTSITGESSLLFLPLKQYACASSHTIDLHMYSIPANKTHISKVQHWVYVSCLLGYHSSKTFISVSPCQHRSFIQNCERHKKKTSILKANITLYDYIYMANAMSENMQMIR